MVTAGSSPRVRGTLELRLGRRGSIRFIPACAGNASSASGSWTLTAVHPRVCGERLTPFAHRIESYGSSPRVRGTPELWMRGHNKGRFIPACAGNAAAVRRTSRSITVHPRVCGERYGRRLGGGLMAGSSPRVRGTPLPLIGRKLRRRFIPACAGNARRSGAAGPRPPVHPRVCGERHCRPERRSACRGSSPRVRGTP